MSSYTLTLLSGDVETRTTLAGPGAQPWGGLLCYVYDVRVLADGQLYETKAYGAHNDYMQGDSAHAEEMGWLILKDLLNAADDPEEFWQDAAVAGVDLDEGLSLDRARGVIELIDYALKIEDLLEQLRGSIDEANE